MTLLKIFGVLHCNWDLSLSNDTTVGFFYFLSMKDDHLAMFNVFENFLNKSKRHLFGLMDLVVNFKAHGVGNILFDSNKAAVVVAVKWLPRLCFCCNSTDSLPKFDIVLSTPRLYNLSASFWSRASLFNDKNTRSPSMDIPRSLILADFRHLWYVFFDPSPLILPLCWKQTTVVSCGVIVVTATTLINLSNDRICQYAHYFLSISP